MEGKTRNFWVKFFKLDKILADCDTEKLKKICRNLNVAYKGKTDSQMKEAIIDKVLGTGNFISTFILRAYVDMIIKL